MLKLTNFVVSRYIRVDNHWQCNILTSIAKTTRNQFGWKCSQNKTSHFVASWYRPPGITSEEFQLFREQLDYIRTHHKGKKLSSVHVLGDFNFKDIDWPDRLRKSGSTLSQSEGQIFIDIMNDHGLEQMVPHSRKEHIGLDSHHSTGSVSRGPLPWQVIMTSSGEPWKFLSPQ